MILSVLMCFFPFCSRFEENFNLLKYLLLLFGFLMYDLRILVRGWIGFDSSAVAR